MAKRTSTYRSTYRTLDILSYIAIILIGISLLLGMIDKLTDGKIKIQTACAHFAQILSYIVIGINSYYYALGRGTRNARFIIWLIAIILIIVSYVVWYI